jgi:hypothetical protein
MRHAVLGFSGLALLVAFTALQVLNFFTGGRPSILGYTPCPRPGTCGGNEMLGPIWLFTGEATWWDVPAVYGVAALGFYLISRSR